MDPISQSAFPMADIAPPEPPAPPPPDVSDVQEFQAQYRDSVPLGDAPHTYTFQGMLNPAIGGALPGTAGDNIFQAALARMAEMHDKNCVKIETLIDRIASGTALSPQEMLQAQMTVSEATTTLGTYQAFDKKTEEGIKALMTGQ